MKRVLILAPQPFFLSRGTPINVRAIAETLSADEYQVDLLAFPFGEDLEQADINVIRSPRVPGIDSVPIGPSWRKIVLDIPFFFHALVLTLSRKYDAIHGIEEAGCIAGVVGILKGIPYVYDMDSCIPTQLEESGFVKNSFLLSTVTQIENFFIRKSSAVLTVCASLSEKASTVLKSDAKIFQIEDFPYAPTTTFTREEVERLQVELSLSDKRVLLYTGNLEQYQGIDMLLESFSLLSDREELLLLIVGGSVETVHKYEVMARRLGIESNTKFTGSRPASEMGALMQCAEVVLSPRIEGENTPLKIYSYMASKRVIVATAINSHTQVLSSENAFLAAPEPEEFAQALRECLGDTGNNSEKIEKAKRLVDTRYSYEHFKSRLLAMYDQMLNSNIAKSGSGALDDDKSARYMNAE